MTEQGRMRRHLAVPLFRNAYALVVTTVLTSSLGLVYWALAARYYPVSEVGRAAAAINTLMLLAGITQLNLVHIIPRFLPRAGRQSARLIIGAYGASAAAAVLVAGAYVALGRADDVLDADRSPWAIRILFVVAVVGWNLFTLQDSVLAGIRQAVWAPIENAVFAVTKIVLLVALASSLPTLGGFASWTLPAGLAVIPMNLLIFRRLLPRHVAETTDELPLPPRRQLVHYVGSDYLGGLLMLASLTVPPLLIVRELGFEANAFYAAPWVLVVSFDVILANIGLSLTVEGVMAERRLPHLARGVARMSGLLSLAAVVAVLIGAPLMLAVLGADYADQGVSVMRILALSLPFRAVTMLFLSLARVRRQLRQLVAVQAASSVLGLLLAAVWLRGGEIEAAAQAWLLTQVVTALVVSLPVVRTLRLPGGGDDVEPPSDPSASPFDTAVGQADISTVDQVAR